MDSAVIGKQGFGCMGMSAFYTSARQTTEENNISVFRKALDGGVTLFNSATFYGPLNEVGYGANLRLIKKCIEGLDRSSYQLTVKICMDTRAPVEKTGTQWIMRSTPEDIRKDVDYALEQLGVDFIDVIILCRVSADVPIEDSVAGMVCVIKEGKAKAYGLSEASAETIRRAAAVSVPFLIEQEWSLWSRDIEEDIVPTCRELGIKILAYCPLGRGFLTGTIRSKDVLDDYDFRKGGHPKSNDENFAKNLALIDNLKALADAKGITTGQLALAWVHAQGPDVIPIPGTTSLAHLEENLAAAKIVLSADDLKAIDELFPIASVSGDRYAHMNLTFHANSGKPVAH